MGDVLQPPGEEEEEEEEDVDMEQEQEQELEGVPALMAMARKRKRKAERLEWTEDHRKAAAAAREALQKYTFVGKGSRAFPGLALFEVQPVPPPPPPPAGQQPLSPSVTLKGRFGDLSAESRSFKLAPTTTVNVSPALYKRLSEDAAAGVGGVVTGLATAAQAPGDGGGVFRVLHELKRLVREATKPKSNVAEVIEKGVGKVVEDAAAALEAWLPSLRPEEPGVEREGFEKLLDQLSGAAAGGAAGAAGGGAGGTAAGGRRQVKPNARYAGGAEDSTSVVARRHTDVEGILARSKHFYFNGIEKRDQFVLGLKRIVGYLTARDRETQPPMSLLNNMLQVRFVPHAALPRARDSFCPKQQTKSVTVLRNSCTCALATSQLYGSSKSEAYRHGPPGEEAEGGDFLQVVVDTPAVSKDMMLLGSTLQGSRSTAAALKHITRFSGSHAPEAVAAMFGFKASGDGVDVVLTREAPQLLLRNATGEARAVTLSGIPVRLRRGEELVVVPLGARHTSVLLPPHSVAVVKQVRLSVPRRGGAVEAQLMVHLAKAAASCLKVVDVEVRSSFSLLFYVSRIPICTSV